MTDLEKKAAAAALKVAFENRNRIASALRDGWRRVRDGKLVVALFGIGGTGKSTAQKLLTLGSGKSSKTQAHVPTVRASASSLQARPFVSVWDTPGQKDFREAAWDEVAISLASASNAVLLNMVSYGHNSTGSVPFANLRKRWPNLSRDEVASEYFKDERARELAFLTDLGGLLDNTRGRTHLLTIVNKQDLWWNKKNRVMGHYTQGSYGQRLDQICHGRPKKRFTRSIKAACLCNLNLTTIDGIVLASTCSGYDVALREASLAELFDEFRQFTN